MERRANLAEIGFNPFQGFIRISTANSSAVIGAMRPFQSLSGIYQDFYVSAFVHFRGHRCVSIPFRDLLGFLRKRLARRMFLLFRFNPFQGFIRISTRKPRSWKINVRNCFNPFQGFIRISTFRQAQFRPARRQSFNPFQGFIRISTNGTRWRTAVRKLLFQSLSGIYQDFYEKMQAMFNVGKSVSIPFRDLLGFLPGKNAGHVQCRQKRFNPFQGFIRISTSRQFRPIGLNPCCFNPFQGFIRIST